MVISPKIGLKYCLNIKLIVNRIGLQPLSSQNHTDRCVKSGFGSHRASLLKQVMHFFHNTWHDWDAIVHSCRRGQ